MSAPLHARGAGGRAAKSAEKLLAKDFCIRALPGGVLLRAPTTTRPEGRDLAFRFCSAPKWKQNKFVAEKASRTLIVVRIARPNYKSRGAKTPVLLRPDRSGHMTC